MRPVIGITCYVEQARWGVWDVRAALVPYAYVEKVQRAGARAVVLPPDSVDADVLGIVDGLVLAGGADVDPAAYGEAAHAQTLGTRPDRDAGELTVYREALVRDLPVLGICRGMQLMAVAHGGRLEQHLPDAVGHEEHRPAPGEYGWHDARFAPGSQVAAAVGETTTVNSYHHQGVASAGSLSVTGWAHDGSIEALEDPAHSFVVGVQWHPEATEDGRLFEALVDAVTARRRSATAG